MITKQTTEKAIIVLAIVGFLALGYVFFQITAAPNSNPVTGMEISNAPQLNTEILPKGVPRIYGAELGVSYDDVSASNQQKADATIAKLGQLDNRIKLDAEQNTRYTKIALQISCEYCCGADSIIFANGQPACGCQHSYAMRGVAKYLVTKHPTEFTDDQILEEMAKWKTLFFPGQISEKAERLQEKGIETNYINLASNKYRE